MNFRILPLLFVVSLSLLIGCTSHLYNISVQRDFPKMPTPLRGRIFDSSVRNGRILKLSGIVKIDERGPHINLVSLQSYPKCGMPFMASAFTLGLIPATIPNPTKANIAISNQDRFSQVVYQLQLEERYSLWEAFNFFHNDDKVSARALAWAYTTQHKQAQQGAAANP